MGIKISRASAATVSFSTPQEIVINKDDDSITAHQGGSWSVAVNNLPGTQPVSGTVSVDNFPVTQPVSGTVNVGNLPVTQPVSGTVDVGNFPVTQAVSGSVSVSNFPATQAVTQSGTWNINNVSGTVSLPTGAATSILQSTGNTSLGNIDTKTPALGQTVMASSVPVALASNQSSIPVANTEAVAATATLSNVAGSASSVQLLAANAARKGAIFYNDSTATLYLKFGTTASTSSFTVKLVQDAYYEVPKPVYSGRIDGIWASATGNVRITELS